MGGQRSTRTCGLFNFAVNPLSFTQTAENYFDLSFLIKQGHASLSLDSDGLPVVSRVIVTASYKGASDQKSTHMVASLSSTDERRAVAPFDFAQVRIHVPHLQR
jgi:hypothetical protein